MALSTPREDSEQVRDAVLQPFRFTIEQYYKMAEAGILKANKRYELVRGFIYEVQPVAPKHATRLKKLEKKLEACLGDHAIVFTQHPLQLAGDSEPQPDILVVKPPIDQYEERHPRPEDVLLVIEIASSTLQSDRTLKLELYAKAGIPESWIVNLHKPQLEIYRDPDTDEARYREVHTFGEGEAVKPLALTGCEVAWWR